MYLLYLDDPGSVKNANSAHFIQVFTGLCRKVGAESGVPSCAALSVNHSSSASTPAVQILPAAARGMNW